MTTVSTSLKQLPRQLDAQGVRLTILAGSVYRVENWWLQNEVFRFAHLAVDDFHPVLVVSVEDGYVNVRLMTTQIERNRDNGVPYTPDHDVDLDKPSMILTKKGYHLRLPTYVLRQTHYEGNVGPDVITWLRLHERLKNDDSARRIGHMNIDVQDGELGLAA